MTRLLAALTVVAVVAAGAGAGEPSASLPKAAQEGRLDRVKQLVARGAPLDQRDAEKGWTPLIHAIRAGHTRVALALLEAGADPSRPSEAGSLPLAFAAGAGNVEVIEALIARGADVNAFDSPKLVPLAYAAEQGHLEAMRVLLRHGAEVNRPGGSGTTPIFMTIGKEQHPGQIEAAELLLRHGARLDARLHHGGTPLMVTSSQSRRPEMVRLFLEHGADANDTNGQATPLDLAAYQGSIEIVMLLLDHGADPTALDSEALKGACSRGHLEIAQLLLKHGAQVRESDSGLEEAARNGHLDCVRLLLEGGARVHDRDFDDLLTTLIDGGHAEVMVAMLEAQPGWADRKPTDTERRIAALIRAAADGEAERVAPLLDDSLLQMPKLLNAALTFARQRGHVETARALQEPAAKATATARQNEMLLEGFLKAVRTGETEAVRAYLSRGVSPNTRDIYSALRMAVWGGSYETVEILIEAGASLHPTENGGCPVSIAAANGRLRILRLLLEHGADPNGLAVNEGGALWDAAYHGHIEAVRLLLEYGGDVDHPAPISRQTALIGAARAGHTEIAKLLLERGAAVNAADERGHTALQYAEAYMHPPTADVLRAAGGRPGIPPPPNPLFDIRVQNNLDEYRRVLEAGADPNARGGAYEGQFTTPLGQIGAAGSLHENGAERIKLLIQHGARVEDAPLLIVTAGAGAATRTLRLLLEHGADPNARAYTTKITPLMQAAAYGQIENARLLLEQGADPMLRTTDGQTARDMARGADIVALLREAEEKQATKR